MAKSNNKHKWKKLNKTQQKLLRKDVLASALIVSFLLNVFFITGLVMFNSTNALDQSMYEVAYSNLCDRNYVENLTEIMEESDAPELSRIRFEAECGVGEFTPYYQNAFEAYLSDSI